jgi:hypothetical protein
MGLLDQMFAAPDSAQAIGLLGAGLMAGNAPAGFQNAINLLGGAKDRDMERQLRAAQLQEAQSKLSDQQRARDFLTNLPSPQFQAGANALAAGGGPTNANAARIPQVSPTQDLLFQGAKAGVVPFHDYAAALQPKAPIKLGAGDSLLDATTYKPLFTNPKEQATPAAIVEYQFAQKQGFPGTFEQWQTAQKKAGATNVSVGVNTEKSLLSNVAEGLGKGLTDAKGQAQASLGTINTVNRLMDSLNTGKVMAGPGTTFRQYGLQVGNMLGVGGKDAQEKMLNTRQAIQSLAQLELDGAQQMKGQGQITEAERSIIKRAASGDVDSMTVPELRLLGGILDRSARFKIQNYNQQVKPLASMPNAAAIAPFLGVQEPPARQAPNVLRFDANGNLIQN